jgi:hypothetical protein
MAKIFCSYSHKDESYRVDLEEHLALLIRQGLIEFWHDRKIPAGARFGNVIDEKIDDADMILLLVSPSFFASDYCYSNEMNRALAREAEGTACVIPVILRPGDDWRSTPLGNLLAVPKDGRPIASWANPDDAYADIAQQIRTIVNVRSKKSTEVRDENTGVSKFPATMPIAIDWPAILSPVLQKLEKIFDHPAFNRSISFDLSNHKIPPALERELNKPSDNVGERSVNALIAVANTFTQELGEKSGNWSAAERILIRTRLESAMGCVAHLCVNPRSRQTLAARSDQTLDVDAKNIPGATLPLRAEPEKSLVRDLDGNRIPIMRDRHAISLIEGGELKPAQDDLTRAMAAHFSEIGAVPPQVNAALIEQIEGLAYNEKQMGRERFLVFGQGATALPASEICNWINNQLGLRVLNITGQSGDLYLFAENKLLARLQGFFKLFEQAEWKTP